MEVSYIIDKQLKLSEIIQFLTQNYLLKSTTRLTLDIGISKNKICFLTQEVTEGQYGLSGSLGIVLLRLDNKYWEGCDYCSA